MPLSFDELRQARKARTKIVEVPLDEDILREIDELERALPLQRHVDETENLPPKAARLEKQLEDLKVQAQAASEEFTFQELPRPTYRELLAAHPSDDKDLRWNEDTFAPALLAATCVSHEFTVDQWKTLWDEWPSWVVYPMFAAAYEVCEQPSRVPFGGSSTGRTRSSGQNSGTADLEG